MESTVSELVRRGHYAHAFAVLKRSGNIPASHESEMIRAELLERLGRPRDAERLANRLLAVPDLSHCLQSRCHTLLGTITLENGAAEDAVHALQTAISIAEQHGCIEQVCWATMRLLIALTQSSAADATPAVVAALRRQVLRAGNPTITAALHVFVSELEAKRGAWSNASRHAKLARSVLEQHENAWLECNSYLAESCAAILGLEIEEAHRAAIGALNAVHVSGHVRSQVAVNINFGHICLFRCELGHAAKYFNQALQLASVSARAHEALLHALAELELARGNVAKCKELLVKMFECTSSESSFVKLCGYDTHARCLILERDWEEASVVVNRGLDRSRHAGDRGRIVLMTLLRAEVRASLGDSNGAAADILAAMCGEQLLSLDVLGEAQRVIGRALAREQDRTAAGVALSRSYRIHNAVGHVRAQRDVEAQRKQEGLEALSPTDTRSGRPDLLLGRLAAIIQQATRPDLLGAEAMDLLLDAGIAQRVAIITALAPKLVVEHAIGWSPQEASAAAPQLQDTTLSLGTWRDAEWRLVAEVPPTVAARAAWLAVYTVVSAGVELAATRREAREREALWPIDNPDEPSHGVFGSEQMVELLRITKRIATTDVTVLVTGETGAGKEVLARVLHDASPRAAKPFVPLNCSAVPREMLEAQLFGHRRGAFTGADAAFPGVFRAAAGGTVFLDEIGEVTLDLQPKLLRFLESGEVHPLGEPQPVKVNVRVVAATNQDLERLVREGRFREDLYYRLNVIHLRVPPLRERREEIPLLVSHFLERFAREFQKGRLRLAEETMEYFVLHAWPGNVRQLANELRRLAALAEPDAVLMPEHLSPALIAGRRTRPASERDLLPTELVVRLDQPLAAATEHLERAMIQHAMTLCHGRVDQVARTLGLSRKGLYLKRQRLKLDTLAS